MTECISQTVYFRQTGTANTERTLELAHTRAEALGIDTFLVATTSGETGALAAHAFQGANVVVVSHSTGFSGPNTQELRPEHRTAIESAGAQLLTCQHALGGVNRAIRRQFDTYQVDEIIAHTLRLFSQGVKVIAEMALMAADAGLVRTDTPVMGIAGTGSGADTAAVVLPTHAQTFFELRLPEIVCCPSPAHPVWNNS